MNHLNEVNNESHSENEFSRAINYGLKNGGIHLVSVKGHGKTRLLFGMARELRKKARVIVFDGSETWLYGFDKIPVFTVKERDVVLAKDLEKTDQIERYKIKKWQLVKLALQTHKDVLFRLKSRKPSKRGFFIRQVVNYLDALQRLERETTVDHEAKQNIAYFIEEAQDAFSSRSTTRLEAEEFLTVFNEARNQKEAFFTASQRLTDFSKTIRTKQTYVIGRIPEEDKSPAIRRLQKKYDVDYSKTEPRRWNFEGKTFESPIWKQNGKPYQINKQLKKKWIVQLKPPKTQSQKKQGLLSRIANCFMSQEDRIIRDIQNYNSNLAADLEAEEQAEEEEELSFFLEEEEWST